MADGQQVMLDETLKNWLDTISDEGPLPTACEAIYIGIFEQDACYALHFLGSTSFDSDDDDWACEKPGDYLPEHRYLADSGIGSSTDWQTVQFMVANGLRQIRAAGGSILSASEHVAVGFDDGDVEHL